MAFFHGVPAEDSRYNLTKDVVDSQLVSIGGDEADDAYQAMEDPAIEAAQPDETIEIL